MPICTSFQTGSCATNISKLIYIFDKCDILSEIIKGDGPEILGTCSYVYVKKI